MVGEYEACQIGQVIEHIVSCDIIRGEIILVVFIPAFYYTCSADVKPLQVRQASDELDVGSVEIAGKCQIDDSFLIAYQFGQSAGWFHMNGVGSVLPDADDGDCILVVGLVMGCIVQQGIVRAFSSVFTFYLLIYRYH